MDDFTKNDMEEALRTINSMIGRAEKAQKKFTQGTSHYTLQKNRIKALYIASSLITKELTGNDVRELTEKDLEEALKPIVSLISKSEKAQKKVPHSKMLRGNLKSLYIASPLITKALIEMSTGNGRIE